MDIVNGVTKAFQNEKLQKALGFLIYQNYYGHGLDNIFGITIQELEALITNPHLPNLSHVLIDVRDSGVFKDLALLGIGGWFAEELGIHPMLTKVGKVAKGVGFNGLIGASIGTVLSHATLENSPGPSEAAMYDRVTSPRAAAGLYPY